MTRQVARLSPNHSARGKATIRWIVLHADASPTEQATLNWICSAASKVSYHVFVHRDGRLTRCVPDDRAAWACGESEWDGVRWLNRHSLSLAFANLNNRQEYLTAAQISAATRVIAGWRQQYQIEAVLTHAMIAPGRKTDPDRVPNFNRELFR